MGFYRLGRQTQYGAPIPPDIKDAIPGLPQPEGGDWDETLIV